MMDESNVDTGAEELVNRIRDLLAARSLLSPNSEKLVLNKLQGLVTNIKWSPADAIDLFNALLKRFDSTTTDRSHLQSWMLGMLHSVEINYITPSWRYRRGKTLIELIQDRTVTDENLKGYLDDDTEKQLDEILEEIRQQKLNQIDEKLLNDVRDIVSSVDKDLASHNDGSQRSGLKKDLLTLCQAVKKTQTYRPRLTQMVSWCIMALSGTGRLIQVGTGEGKSCIVAMFAAFRAMKGEMVDILTSSSVLAERDIKDWRAFYRVLNISVNCNTNIQDEEKLKECYKCQVVYGTVEEFAGDWLKQHFERMDIFGKRKFQCAIVDEVDSLMLDKGLDAVYIGTDMPALQLLNPLLAFIWTTANQYENIGTDTFVGQKYPFHQVVLENITKGKDVDKFTILQIAEDTGVLEKGSVRDLRKDLSLLTEKTKSVTVNQMAKFFRTVERKFPSCQFDLHCLNTDRSVVELNKQHKETAERQRVPLLLISGGFCQYMYSDESVQTAVETEIKRVLHFTPCELSQDEGSCYVPGFLSDLVKAKLKVWIDNAFCAQNMTEDHEYVVEKHGVVPVDYSSTGVVQNFRVLTDGLQQFLEMKHSSKLSDMTAITNYMSNVGLLQKYGDQIYGMSGTLGQQAETETLQKIYNGIKTCQIPSFKRRKLFEVEGVTVDDEKEWIKKICDVVTAQTNPTPYRDQRAVLIICETINRAKALHDALGHKVLNKKLYISNNMDNTALLKKELEAGEVIIATNLAGRGTDLKVSEAVKRAGGLFVVLTFLPVNARVEAQAFGRTARQGSPGSAQLIVCTNHLPEPPRLLVLANTIDIMSCDQYLFMKQLRLYCKSHSNEVSKDMSLTLNEKSKSGIKTIKSARDLLAVEQLTSFLGCDIPNIKKKEELFSLYLDTLDELYKSRNNKPAASDLSALNEFWGMWLLTNFSEKASIMDLKSKLSKDLKTAREKLELRESPSSNLHHYVAFGNELREKGHLAESIRMYTKAIQEDHCWAAIAYYNRAFASLAQKNQHQDPICIDQALEDLQNALKSVELYRKQTEVTHRYFTQVKGTYGDSAPRFSNHMNVRYIVLLCFQANINEAIKKVDRAKGLGGNVKVDESFVYFLVPSEYFLPLASELMTLIRSRDPLKLLQVISDPSFDIFNELRCLECLGLSRIYTLDTLFSLGGFFSKLLHRIIR